jgi:glycerate kinase
MIILKGNLPVKILVAPNSFKESLNSLEVARHIRIGLKKASKKFQITEVPLADGGTGTVYVLVKALKGKFVRLKVSGPLNKKVFATYGIIPKQKIAIIELAEAAGLKLVPEKRRNPLLTTTKGVGELILDAVNKNCKKIILGIGDSTTIDLGVGAISVLGVRFFDNTDNEIELNCRGLLELKKIDASKIYKKLKNTKVIIASDVKNILTGKKGALIYAKQKGAKRTMIPVIHKALRNFKEVILKQYGINLDTILGSGAAGGIGGAMKVILNAEIKSGFEIIKAIVALEKKIEQSDLIITGEGKIDKQNLYGKTTKKVVDIAYKYKKPVILIAGNITKDAENFYKYGVIEQYSILTSSISIKNAIKNAPKLLEDLAYSIGKRIC